MSASGKTFEFGGIVVPLTAALGLQENWDMVDGGVARHRMMNGAGYIQTAWRKLAVSISGDGWSPLGLQGLDYTAPMPLKCGLPRAVRSQSAAIALPLGRRTDAGYEPFARAHLADGREIDTGISIAAHVATLAPIAGAVSYAVWYWPELVVIASEPQETFDQGGAIASWSINCEEA
jgi:hypothetical protein